ncbi:MAG TPA: periplasmic heavy metal sensor [Thermoanaerobaculia bacterium]|nr:periplasmic heavy metal sensor [Thermoanaerobaculia bacterium]
MKKILLAVFVLLTIGVEAQPMPGKWWRREEIAQKLELNREQQRRLDEIFQAVAGELIDLKAQMTKLELQLRGELDRTQLRRTEIQRIAAQLNTARGRMFERELMMLVDMRGVLEEEQWQRLQDMDLPRLGPGGGPPGGRRPPH